MTCVTTVQLIQDWILFVIVFAIVLVDATILLVGTSIPQTRLNATLVSDGEHGFYVNVRHVYPDATNSDSIHA